MCSNIEDDLSCEEISKLAINEREKGTDLSFPTQCKKCNENPATVLIRTGDAYCTSCLQLSVTHKFRSCLGKSKLMKSGEKVLLAYSGGFSSSAMLHLAKEGLLESSHKRLRFVPIVIFIDESEVQPSHDIYEKNIFKEVYSKVAQFGFPLYVSKLSMVMASSVENVSKVIEGGDFTLDSIFRDHFAAKLKDLFHSVTSLSSKEDLLLKLRQKLLHTIAKELGCTKICLGDTETRIAVRVLADIALGKGSQLTQTCGFLDDRFEDVLMIRPLRETMAKEISFYVKSHNLQTVILPRFTTKHDGSGSIQHCTESFVYGLQNDFQSTVPTIFRVGDKMGSAALPGCRPSKVPVSKDTKLSNPTCVVCSGMVDAKTDGLQLSPPFACSDKKLCTGKCDCSAASSNQRNFTLHDLETLCCYSCQLILKEMKTVDNLPPHVTVEATSKLQRSRMKEKISEYLLNPDD